MQYVALCSLSSRFAVRASDDGALGVPEGSDRERLQVELPTIQGTTAMLQRTLEAAAIDKRHGLTGIKIMTKGGVLYVATPTTEYTELLN